MIPQNFMYMERTHNLGASCCKAEVREAVQRLRTALKLTSITARHSEECLFYKGESGRLLCVKLCSFLLTTLLRKCSAP